MPDPTETVVDFGAYLVAQGIGTLEVGPWAITFDEFSESVDQNIMIQEAPGGQQITASQTKNPHINIYVRTAQNSLEACRTKAREILDALAFISQTRIAGGTMYQNIRSQNSAPAWVGRDPKGKRPRFLVQFSALRSTVNSGA